MHLYILIVLLNMSRPNTQDGSCCFPEIRNPQSEIRNSSGNLPALPRVIFPAHWQVFCMPSANQPVPQVFWTYFVIG